MRAAVPGMRAHLEGCPACAEERDSLRDLVADEHSREILHVRLGRYVRISFVEADGLEAVLAQVAEGAFTIDERMTLRGVIRPAGRSGGRRVAGRCATEKAMPKQPRTRSASAAAPPLTARTTSWPNFAASENEATCAPVPLVDQS